MNERGKHPEIKALFFDVAGTLFHLPKGVGWHYRAVAKRHGADLREDSLNQAFRSAWKHAEPPPETRSARPDDDRDWWRSLVGRVLDTCEVHHGILDRERYFTDLYSEFTQPGVWELYPEVTSVLGELAPRFRLGVLSNFDGRLRAVLAHLGIDHFFQDWIISSEVGADKPSAWIYEQALLRAGVSASEALHVGDDPVCDWSGAADAGLRVFQLDRPRNDLAGVVAMLGYS